MEYRAGEIIHKLKKKLRDCQVRNRRSSDEGKTEGKKYGSKRISKQTTGQLVKYETSQQTP